MLKTELGIGNACPVAVNKEGIVTASVSSDTIEYPGRGGKVISRHCESSKMAFTKGDL
jgi:hypothetical protein